MLEPRAVLEICGWLLGRVQYNVRKEARDCQPSPRLIKWVLPMKCGGWNGYVSLTAEQPTYLQNVSFFVQLFWDEGTGMLLQNQSQSTLAC